MKRALLISLLIAGRLYAQNIVPNAGFETYSAPPSSPGQYANATGWNNCNGGGSPDYFSTLGSGIVQLPNCFIGTLNPHSGNGACGAAFYYYSPSDYREYLDIKFITPMIIGNKYDVSFYISNGVTSGTYGGGGINQVSVAFTTNELTQVGTLPIPFTPQYIYSGTLYNHAWQLITFQFTADSAYQYITLGNFKNDASTVYQQFDACSSYGAYYFFDDFNVQVATGLPPVAGFSTADTVICAQTCISFSNLSTNATSWNWFFPGANPSSDTAATPQNICYLDSGTFDVTLVAINSAGTDTVKLTNYIAVSPDPPTPVITQHTDTLICSNDPSYTAYQWYADTTLIPGATTSSLIISNDGNYNIQVTNKSGCKIAVGINVILDVRNLSSSSDAIFLFPDPAVDELRIHLPVLSLSAIVIYNTIGQVCHQVEMVDSKPETDIDVSSFRPGIYFVEMTGEKGRWVGKFVKQ